MRHKFPLSLILKKCIYLMHKPNLYVVEGQHDLARLKSVDSSLSVFVTHGMHFSNETTEQLKTLASSHTLILLLDPDGAGARIEARIRQTLPDVSAIYVPKSDAQREDGKIGIEHMTKAALKKALDQGAHPHVSHGTWTLDKLFDYGLVGVSKARINRQLIAEKYAIPYTNAKQFATTLNRFGITDTQVKEGLSDA